MGFLAMNEQHWIFNLMCPCKQWLVHERLAANYVPTIGAVATALVITALCLVVIIIVFHKEWRIVGKWINHAASTLVGAILVVLGALGSNGFALFHAFLFGIFALEVTLHVHLAHVIHSRGYCCLDAWVEGGSIDGHATKTAYAYDANALGVYILLHAQEVNCCKEILGVDVGRSHAAGFTSTLASERGVEGDCQESALCHVLGIEAAALLFNGSKRTAHCDGRKFTICAFWCVHVGG